jgi:hypothetical protein
VKGKGREAEGRARPEQSKHPTRIRIRIGPEFGLEVRAVAAFSTQPAVDEGDEGGTQTDRQTERQTSDLYTARFLLTHAVAVDVDVGALGFRLRIRIRYGCYCHWMATTMEA